MNGLPATDSINSHVGGWGLPGQVEKEKKGKNITNPKVKPWTRGAEKRHDGEDCYWVTFFRRGGRSVGLLASAVPALQEITISRVPAEDEALLSAFLLCLKATPLGDLHCGHPYIVPIYKYVPGQTTDWEKEDFP